MVGPGGFAYNPTFPAPITFGVTNSTYDTNGNLVVPSPLLGINQWAVDHAWGWHAFLLPQIEQGTIKIDFRRGKDLIDNQQFIRIPIETYMCPSNPLPAQRPDALGFSTYRGVMGAQPLNDTTPAPPIGDHTTFSTNGVMYQNSGVRFRDITDGQSNTLLLGDSRFGFWGDGFSCCARFRNDRNDFDSFWPYPIAPATLPADELQFFSFGGFHDEAVIFGLSDGSSRPIAKNINSDLLRRLATRAEGLPIDSEY
jgi:hypothetical protein